MRDIKTIRISTVLDIEINEICEIFINNNRNCIKISQLLKYLKYKDPISYKNLDYWKTKKAFVALFPIHKNRRKKTKHFKISRDLVIINKQSSDLKMRPAEDVKIEDYGIDKKLFKKV